jgi:hypothetical protein
MGIVFLAMNRLRGCSIAKRTGSHSPQGRFWVPGIWLQPNINQPSAGLAVLLHERDHSTRICGDGVMSLGSEDTIFAMVH